MGSARDGDSYMRTISAGSSSESFLLTHALPAPSDSWTGWLLRRRLEYQDGETADRSRSASEITVMG